MTVPPGLARVLIVDDEEEMRDALTLLLSSAGFDVVGTADNGREGVDLAAFLRPDLVVMDLRMPMMDGIEATRLIKEQNPWIQVLILSAYEDVELRSAASDAGIYCYLIKGMSPWLIIDMLIKAKVHGQGLPA